MSDYTEAQYRTETAEAIKEFHWWQRPLIRLAVWITEQLEGTPDHPGLRRRS